MNYFKNIKAQQQGSSLLTVLVVLLVLSLLAIASYDSSNLQSLMTRNSQLRLETFNTGKVEIEAQVADFRAVAIGSIDENIAQLLDSAATEANINLDQKSQVVGFDKTVTLSKDGGCAIYGSDIDAKGSTCTSFVIGVTISPEYLNIASAQKQTFDMTSLKE